MEEKNLRGSGGAKEGASRAWSLHLRTQGHLAGGSSAGRIGPVADPWAGEGGAVNPRTVPSPGLHFQVREEPKWEWIPRSEEVVFARVSRAGNEGSC